MKFKRKVHPIEAVQFTWDNVDELTALSGVECTRWDEGGMQFADVPRSEHHYACMLVGEWLVKENDVVKLYTDEEFQVLFEKIDEDDSK